VKPPWCGCEGVKVTDNGARWLTMSSWHLFTRDAPGRTNRAEQASQTFTVADFEKWSILNTNPTGGWLSYLPVTHPDARTERRVVTPQSSGTPTFAPSHGSSGKVARYEKRKCVSVSPCQQPNRFAECESEKVAL
jgi:hypothetical protein